VKSDHDPIAGLIEEYVALRRAGKISSVEEFASAHSVHAGRLREILPAVELMEAADPTRPPLPRVDPLAGTGFGDYRILRELGRGGMGVVYEAQQESMVVEAETPFYAMEFVDGATLARTSRTAGVGFPRNDPQLLWLRSFVRHDV